MKLILFNLAFLLFATQLALAQETIKIENASRKYDLIIQVQEDKSEANKWNNSGTAVNGSGRISIYKKGAQSPFQVLRLHEIEMYREQIAYNPNIDKNRRQLYDDEYSIIVDDFNFDGEEDLAICNGRHGGYGAPSYKVYLFDKTVNKFIANRRLSKLTEGIYLGLFFPNSKKKTLTAFWKSGCCYHETEIYKVSNNRPVLIEKIIEDVRGEGAVTITTKKIVNGQWRKSVKKMKRIPEQN